MSTVYHTSAAPSFVVPPSTFEKRWKHVEPLLRLYLVSRDDDHVNALVEDARQHLWAVCTTKPELLDASSDVQWVEIALQGVLRINEQQTHFNQQFEIIQWRLHNWARQHFKPEVVEDVVQSAFIKLWEDYQRHRQGDCI